MTNEELYYLPASELIKNIQAEKERLIKEKVISKSKPLPPINDDEKPFKLPNDWEWAYFEDLSLISTDYVANGSFKSLRENVKSFKTPDYALLVKTQDFSNGFSRDLTYIDKDSYEFLSKSKLFGGELMLSNIGASIGKVFIIPNLNIPMSLAPNSIMVRCSNKIITNYLKYLMQSNYGQTYLKKLTEGTAMPKFSKTQLRCMIIPVPPLYIQDQIVQKLEQLSETKDALLSHAKSQLNYTKKMREALLQEAIHGELVPQDKNDEPASILLEKIKAEKERLIKEKVIKKQKELPPITDEEKPYDLPEGWEWVRLGDVAQFNPRNKASDDDLVGFIPMAAITDGFSNTHSFEIKKWAEVKSGYTHFATNDVIFAKITPCFENRKSTIVKDLPNRIGAGTTEVITLRSYANTILPGYLLSLVNSPAFINGGKLTYLGTAGQQRVNAEFLKNYVFALPPLAEQERIIAKLDELMANCDQLEAKAEEMKKYTINLFEASLKEEFMPE